MENTGLIENDRMKKGRKRKYDLDILEIISLSKEKSTREIAKMYKTTQAVIVKIISGSYMLEEHEIDHERIKSLGLKLCQCCKVRIVPLVPIRTNGYNVRLTRLCPYCFRYGESGSFEPHRISMGYRKEFIGVTFS